MWKRVMMVVLVLVMGYFFSLCWIVHCQESAISANSHDCKVSFLASRWKLTNVCPFVLHSFQSNFFFLSYLWPISFPVLNGWNFSFSILQCIDFLFFLSFLPSFCLLLLLPLSIPSCLLYRFIVCLLLPFIHSLVFHLFVVFYLSSFFVHVFSFSLQFSFFYFLCFPLF